MLDADVIDDGISTKIDRLRQATKTHNQAELSENRLNGSADSAPFAAEPDTAPLPSMDGARKHSSAWNRPRIQKLGFSAALSNIKVNAL